MRPQCTRSSRGRTRRRAAGPFIPMTAASPASDSWKPSARGRACGAHRSSRARRCEPWNAVATGSSPGRGAARGSRPAPAARRPGARAPAGPAPAVRPVRGQMLALRSPGAALRHVLFHGAGCLTPRHDGEVLVGGTVEDAGFDKAVTAPGVLTLLDDVRRIVPSALDWPITRL